MSGYIGDLLGSVSASDWIKAGTTIGGAVLAANANSNAADTAAAANTQAAQTTSDAATKAAQIIAQSNKDALASYQQFAGEGRDQLNAAKTSGLAAIDQGTQDYANTVNPLLSSTPILLPQYRGLTAQQQTGEGDMLRNASATLAASGLRGAGRAGVGAVLDQDRRYQEDARATNDTDTKTEMRRAQSVAQNARLGLAGVQAAAGGAKANTEVGVGNQLAASYNNTGTMASNLTSTSGNAAAGAVTSGAAATSNALTNNANTTANAGLADAKTYGSTLGSLGSIIASNLQAGPVGSGSSGSTTGGGSTTPTGSDDDPFSSKKAGI